MILMMVFMVMLMIPILDNYQNQSHLIINHIFKNQNFFQINHQENYV